jgi:putative transposase
MGIAASPNTILPARSTRARVSSTLVSQTAAKLDESFGAWRNRAVSEIVYVFLDARYEKVRQDGQIREAAFLITVGLDSQSRRRILNVSISLTKAEIH